PASLSTSATRSWRPAVSASFSRPCTSSRSAMSRLRARSWSIGPSSLAGRLGVHVIVSVTVGRAAHHAQHSEPAGADESDDQGGGEDRRDNQVGEDEGHHAAEADAARLGVSYWFPAQNQRLGADEAAVSDAVRPASRVSRPSLSGR